MKNKNRNIKFPNEIKAVFLTIMVLFLFESYSYAQYERPSYSWSNMLKHWSVGLSIGQSSFYGDVSLYDNELSDKLSTEGSWSYGFKVARQLTPVIGIQGQLLFGELKGKNSISSFEANINQLSVNATLNFVNLLLPGNDSKFFLLVKMGFGQYIFDSRLRFNDPNKPDIEVNTGTPEFLFVMGPAVYYKISNSFNINADMDVQWANNDKLDGTTNNNKDDDYYTYLSVGITYKINNVNRSARGFRHKGGKFSLIKRR
ncbi:MAG: hypothetical protein DRJ05_05625 [Bacteroidetes bacterium]|nr:MAG: hypothetical protein DRJ05_05625 [Bacteroidota bacterium]